MLNLMFMYVLNATKNVAILVNGMSRSLLCCIVLHFCQMGQNSVCQMGQNSLHIQMGQNSLSNGSTQSINNVHYKHFHYH